MVVSFLDGSAVVDSNLRSKIKEKVRALILDEQQVIFYFYISSDFISLCESVVSELQADCPDKVIESVGIVRDSEKGLFTPKAIYTRRETLFGDEAKTTSSTLKWMIDQADYVFCYMDPLICCSECRIHAYRYACARKKSHCINLCSEADMRKVREMIGTLPVWEKEAITAKMNREKKSIISSKLGVCRSTIRAYEISAALNLAKKLLNGKQQEISGTE